MDNTKISRRGLVKGAGVFLTGSLVNTTGMFALFAPSRSWALELTTLSAEQGKILLRLTRHIYPHDTLEDAVYALVVKDLDAAAQADTAERELLIQGIKGLDSASGGNWLGLPDAEQLKHVESIAESAFFEKVRSTANLSLYNNDMAFMHFGYPGDKGNAGYLRRGFNDLTWLPEPPLSDGGPVPDAA